MNDTEWAEGQRVQWEETSITKGERARLRPLVAIGLVAAFGMIMLVLGGCAAPAKDEAVWHRVCYEQPLGQTEHGHLVVQHSCVTLEAFKAAQR